MDSSYYANRITECQAEISNCNNRIVKLEIVIADLGKILTYTTEQCTAYEDKISFYMGKNDLMFNSAAVANVARIFCPQMDADLTGEECIAVKKHFNDTIDAITIEKSNQSKMLENEQSTLASLKASLDSCKSSYQYCLRQEAEMHMSAGK